MNNKDLYFFERWDELEYKEFIEMKEKEVEELEIKLKEKLTELKNLKR